MGLNHTENFFSHRKTNPLMIVTSYVENSQFFSIIFMKRVLSTLMKYTEA